MKDGRMRSVSIEQGASRWPAPGRRLAACRSMAGKERRGKSPFPPAFEPDTHPRRHQRQQERANNR